MLSGWKIGRIGGIDIRIDPSWPIIALLITFNLWAQFADPSRFPSTPQALSVVLAVATAVLFFLSVLAHELAHAGVSRLRGIPVAGITLFFFGGATHAKIESHGPGDEFVVTAAGPITSLASGGLFWLVHQAVGHSAGAEARVMFGYLGFVNVALGLFNLLPGFPLDGGRLLRSVIWHATGSIATATRIAGRAGQVVGGLLGLAGLGSVVSTGDFTFAWFALIGWFLFRAASEAIVDGERKRRMEGATAREVMSPPPPTIPADLRLDSAVGRYLRGHDGEAFPVTDGGRIVGFVSLRTAEGVAPDRPVREATSQLEGLIEAGPDERLDRVAERLGQDRGRAVLVMDRGHLVGVIEPDDLRRYFRRPEGIPPRPD